MSQHDYSIDNQTFPAFRTDLNNLAAAIASLNSGTSSPSVTYAGMLWYDTTNGLIKQRNSANGAWLTLFPIGKQGLIDQNGSSVYAADSVGTDSYAITLSPAITAYATGQVFRFKAGTANTGAVTLNVNSVGAITIKKNYNSDLVTGDILANQIVEVVYDGTNFQLLSAVATSPIFTKSYESAQQTITAAGSLTLAHSLGTTPKIYNAYLQCLTAENGYSIADETGAFFFCDGSTVSRGLTIVPDATNLNVRIGSQATSSLAQIRKDTGARATVTNANWALVFRAWA